MTPTASPASDAPDTTGTRWTVVVPVKPATIGKSRLAEAAADREALARAIALDTIEAAAGAGRVDAVIVVSDDAPLTAAAGRMPRVTVIGEGGAAGLDAAIARGAAAADPGNALAALLGDLPALRSADLDAALAAAEGLERALVPDAEGTGSTLVTARPGAVWVSAFGADSAARHRLLGCTELDVPAESSLRRDVDTVDQLTAAASLGLGPRTSAILSAAD